MGVTRADAFAAAIAARRRGRIGAHAFLAMPLLTLALPERMTHAPARGSRTSVSHYSRLDLAVTLRPENGRTRIVHLPAAARDVAMPVAREASRPAASAARRLESRLRTRERRVEAAPPSTAPAIGTPAPTRSRMPVMPLVSRPRAADVVTSTASPQAPAPWSASAPAAPPRGIAPTELAKLTDEVMRAIDHRIAAQRERRGRR